MYVRLKLVNQNWVTIVIVTVLMYIHSIGNYIQISGEGKATVCVGHFNGSICNQLPLNIIVSKTIMILSLCDI